MSLFLFSSKPPPKHGARKKVEQTQLTRDGYQLGDGFVVEDWEMDSSSKSLIDDRISKDPDEVEVHVQAIVRICAPATTV